MIVMLAAAAAASAAAETNADSLALMSIDIIQVSMMNQDCRW